MKVLHLEKDLGHCLEKDEKAPKKSSRQSNWGTKPKESGMAPKMTSIREDTQKVFFSGRTNKTLGVHIFFV